MSRMCTSCYDNYTLSLENTCEKNQFRVVFYIKMDAAFKTAPEILKPLKKQILHFYPDNHLIEDEM